MKEKILKIIKNFRTIEIGYCITSLFVIYRISLIDNRIGINSILIPIITILMYYFFSRFRKKKLEKRLLIFSIIFSAIVSIFIIIGTQLEVKSEIIWQYSTITDIICLSIMVLPILYIIFEYMGNIKISKKVDANKKYFITAFLFIFISGFLVFLAMYPGMYGYDGIYQINRVLNNTIDTHYSVIYCYYLNLFIQISSTIGRGHEFAIALYSFVQLIIMSSISAYACYFTLKKTKNLFLYIIALLFYVILLPYKIMVVSTAQDTLFAGIFTLLFINIIEYITDSDYLNNNKIKKYLIMNILVVLLCLLRNNGFYALLFLIVLFFMLRIKNYKYLLVCFIMPLIIFKIISGPVYKIIGVDLSRNDDNTIKEMSSIPGQQLAHAYMKHKESFSKKDKETLEKYYGKLDELEYFAKMHPSISDDTKNRLDIELVKKNKLKYLFFWSKIGLKYPMDYAESFLMQNLGLFYPFKKYPDTRMYHPLIEYRSLGEKKFTEESDKYYTLKNRTMFKEYDDYIRNNIQENNWQNIPIVSLLNNLGFYLIVTIITLIITLYKKKYEMLFPVGLIIGLYITLFLAPVALYRYVFPIVCVSPIYMYIIVYCNEKKNLKKVGSNNEK